MRGNANRARDAQPHFSKDARARIPSAVASGVVHAHGKGVFSLLEVQGGVEPELRVAVRMIAQGSAVQPQIAIHVDAFEAQLDFSARRQLWFVERLAIPAHSADRPSGGNLALAR